MRLEVNFSTNLPIIREARPWRNNLAAGSRKYSYCFLAIDERIIVFDSLHLGNTAPRYTLSSNGPHTPCNGDIDSKKPHSINTLHVGELGQEEVLVCSRDCGIVEVWYTSQLECKPLVFNVGRSAWGIDTHAERRLLAISSNSKEITVFYLSTSSKHPKKVLSGVHTTNIPSIGFDESGNLLSSTSINGERIIWDLATGSCILRSLPFDGMGWNVSFVSKCSFQEFELPVNTSKSNKKGLPLAIPALSLDSIHICIFDLERDLKGHLNTSLVPHLADSDEDDILTDSANDETFNSRLVADDRLPIKSNNDKCDVLDLSEDILNLLKHQLLFSTTEKSAGLTSLPNFNYISKAQSVFKFSSNDLSYISHFQRINMVIQLSKLGILVCGSQMGCIGVYKMVKSGTTFSLLPKAMITCSNPPSSPILGISVTADHYSDSIGIELPIFLTIFYYNSKCVCFEILEHRFQQVNTAEIVI